MDTRTRELGTNQGTRLKLITLSNCQLFEYLHVKVPIGAYLFLEICLIYQ